MQKKFLVPTLLLLLTIFSSFHPQPVHSPTRLTPSALDLFVQNNINADITQVDFVSPLQTISYFNIPAGGGFASGFLQFDDQNVITVIMTFNGTPSPGAVARFYNNQHTLVGTIPVVTGANRFRLYPPIASDAILVIVDPN
ncbi:MULTISPECIES: hypothetical protein [Niastella]|uniref:Uncharacterized protein n=1 Tax=Niastella soli TaxID=2821487 RepID=A0ABS3YXC1_9BACT|nr:hypothetical protein [Niastella soli]MBO9202575.1 hypothetical protein [Niastella soli]